LHQLIRTKIYIINNKKTNLKLSAESMNPNVADILIEATMDVVEVVLGGKVNKDIVTQIN